MRDMQDFTYNLRQARQDETVKANEAHSSPLIRDLARFGIDLHM